jgi:hypothetical protein
LFLKAFDGLAPWTSADYSLNNPPYQQAYNWAQGKHSALVKGVGNYTGMGKYFKKKYN